MQRIAEEEICGVFGMIAERNLTLVYPVVAIAVLVAGIGVNRMAGHTFNGNINPIVSLMTLLLIYFVLHLCAISLAVLIGQVLTPHYRAIVYLILTISASTGTLLTLTPDKNGVHLIVIFAASLTLIAIYYSWLVYAKSSGGV